MRQSHLFGRTLREAPTEAQTPGHRLILRAAIARPLAAGIYSLLPLGFRVAQKVERIIREEMDRIGCQEMEMPVFVPAEYWKETGQWDSMEPITFRFRDHAGHDYVVSYTHEQIVTHHARTEILSYRQLPIRAYHFQMKGRDEARARAGLLRVREFVMKDSYSFDADDAGLDVSYRAHFDAYVRIYRRLGVPAIAVESDTGAIGGDLAHEFQVLTEHGEDTILVCPNGDYTANRELATRRVPEVAAVAGVAAPEPLSTPSATTIADLARFGFAPKDTLKTILLRGPAGLVAVVLPGDREVNEPKLRRRLGLGPATKMPFANEADFAEAGGVPGYIGPIGLHAQLLIDTSVEPRAYLAGANKVDTHLRNVLVGRDFTGGRADVHDVRDGDLCPRDGAPLRAEKGIEVGNIFKLGTYYSQKMNATYLAEDGTRKPFVMGSYGIGIGRNVQSIVEVNHDDKGIVWPLSVAPYEVHVLALQTNDAAVVSAAERLVSDLEQAGVEVLFDDRAESAGVKFADSDLIGIPFRVTVSARGLKTGTVELKPRRSDEVQNIPLAEAATSLVDTVERERSRYREAL